MQDRIDAATRDFIARTDASYPPDAASLPIAGQRAVYDRMCAAFAKARPAGVTARDQAIAGVPCRVYAGAGPAQVVYLHGGGFVLGGLDSHDDACAGIAAATGLQLVSVDYRLAPEHPHPAALHDTCAVIAALRASGPVVLAGDSAGGNLAAAAAHALRDQGILGQVLIYPLLGGDRSRGSYVTQSAAPMLTTADVAFYDRIRHGDGPQTDDASTAPLCDTDFTGLPMTLALGAECDPLADDAPDYAARIRAAGGLAHAEVEPGLVHGHLRARHDVPRAAASFAKVTAAVAAFAEGRWPFG